MNKDYKFLYDFDTEKPNTTQPFSLIRSKDALTDDGFIIWKLNYKKQNVHAHEYYQIWYVFRGSCDHMIDNKKFHLRGGDLIIIPPFSYHSMYNGSEDLIVVGIDFTESFFADFDSFQKIISSCINPIFFKQQGSTSIFFGSGEIENLILETFSEYVLKNEFYENIIKSNLIKLLIMINRKANDNDTRDSHSYLIGEVLRYIHNNLNSRIKIDDLCETANVSPSLLGQCFKKVTGKTIIEYVNCLKTDRAKQLLKETNMSVTDISYDLGFSDIAYFNRVFKKNTNQSPNAYRKSYLK